MINRIGVVGSCIIIIYSFSLFVFQVHVSNFCVPEPNFTENKNMCEQNSPRLACS